MRQLFNCRTCRPSVEIDRLQNRTLYLQLLWSLRNLPMMSGVLAFETAKLLTRKRKVLSHSIAVFWNSLQRRSLALFWSLCPFVNRLHIWSAVIRHSPLHSSVFLTSSSSGGSRMGLTSLGRRQDAIFELDRLRLSFDPAEMFTHRLLAYISVASVTGFYFG